MLLKRVLIVAVASVLFAAAGAAAAGNFSLDRQVDYFASGTHQFYVWCRTQLDGNQSVGIWRVTFFL